MKKLMTIVGIIICCSLVGCCGIRPYVPTVQQGNIIEIEKVAQLQQGMSKQKVLSILGEPVLVDVFNADLWTYAYTKQVRGGKITRKDVVLTFRNNQLIKIEKDLPPKLK